MMLMNEGIYPFSIYIGGKGVQHIYKQPTIISCRPTQVKCSNPSVHMPCSKVMLYTIRAPRRCSYSWCVHTSPFQAHTDSITPHNPCTPLGQFPLQKQYHNPGNPKPTLILHLRIQPNTFHLWPNALHQDAEWSSSQVGRSPSNWISPRVHNARYPPRKQENSNVLRKNAKKPLTLDQNIIEKIVSII